MHSSTGDGVITKLPHERWKEYRALRLHALSDCPVAFQEDFKTAKGLPDSTWQDWLATRILYFYQKDGVLVGMAGFYRKEGVKQDHLIHIVGVYVMPESRGSGIAGQLLSTIEKTAMAMSGVRKLTLGAVATQTPALHLYQKQGFEIVGCRKEQVHIGDRYFDEYILEKFLS